MDNFHIDVTAEGESNLLLALKLGLSQHNSITHWAKHPELGLVLFWANPCKDGREAVLKNTQVEAFPFPHKMGAEDLLPIALVFLREAEYGRQPDHDGDNGKGFRVFCEGWGHVGQNHYACLAIQPAWAMYGK